MWHIQLLNILSLLIIGCGIGWLIGLSVTPVLSVVITSVTGSAATIIAISSGLKNKDGESKSPSNRQLWVNELRITPGPLAIVIVGLLIGSTFGILARNGGWLGTDVSIEINKWTDAGLSKEEITRRLFENDYSL